MELTKSNKLTIGAFVGALAFAGWNSTLVKHPGHAFLEDLLSQPGKESLTHIENNDPLQSGNIGTVENIDTFLLHDHTPGLEETSREIIDRYGSTSEMNIIHYTANAIEYEFDSPKKPFFDHYQKPLETLQRKKGDCDDISILARSLLRNNGHNAYIVDYDSNNKVDPGHLAIALPVDKSAVLYERYLRVLKLADNEDYSLSIKPTNTVFTITQGSDKGDRFRVYEPQSKDANQKLYMSDHHITAIYKPGEKISKSDLDIEKF